MDKGFPLIATVAPSCLLGLTFVDFYLAPKRKVWLLRIWFDTAPVNKLVSMMWLLWALRSFQRFTLQVPGAALIWDMSRAASRG